MPPPTLAVLIVDDCRDTTESLAIFLRGEAYDVRTAASGPEALKLLSDWQPDVAILDLLMPTMDGIDLADRISAVAKRPPRFVMVSGSANANIWKRAVRFDYRFPKPVHPRVLLDVLKSYAAAERSPAGVIPAMAARS